MDDVIPHHGQCDTSAAFMSSRSGLAAWPYLLEKAFAKLNGANYGGDACPPPPSRLRNWKCACSGLCSPLWYPSRDSEGVIQMLLGPNSSPSWQDSRNADQVVQKVTNAIRNRWPMMCGIDCRNQDDYNRAKQVGLNAQHAYAVLGAITLSNHVSLIRLRNPWSQGEWNGDWSDNDRRWTRPLQDEVGRSDTAGGSFHAEDDSAFFIPVDEFIRWFRNGSLMVCECWEMEMPWSWIEMWTWNTKTHFWIEWRDRIFDAKSDWSSPFVIRFCCI